ncbi:MAG: hypothetical protein HeimC3_36430 [Candidatus Heimdallarchaeota archaeon LC_3]|nr:MAG: hypothetical protein HeimC3_36430 [Candidatus Heimdallarchaeota archaeon LC_3]
MGFILVTKSNPSSYSPNIDLERSELRYIFYMHDQDELTKEFLSLGFNKTEYKESPITQTIYFSSLMGLEPGLSIKARIYTTTPANNVMNLDSTTSFDVLEIKSTVSQQEATLMGLQEISLRTPSHLIDSLSKKKSRDKVFRILKASEDGVLRDSTFKTKSRLKKTDLNPDQTHAHLKFSDIITLLSKKSDLDEKLSPELKSLLEKSIRPKYQSSLFPFIMTQYERIHLVPEVKKLQDVIRITIDPGVEYYDIIVKNHIEFLKNPRSVVEFIKREKFCRLEFKLDPLKLKAETTLTDHISDILGKYRCMAYISKKWTGATLVSERYIAKQALWKEITCKNISGYFYVDDSWFNYRQISKRFYQLIELSPTFDLYEPEPKVLVKTENYVTAYLGVPTPSLVINIEGPLISYKLPTKSYPIKLVHGEEFYITEELEHPVRVVEIDSNDELSDILHPAIEIEGDSFFRSYGFLVISKSTSRVYKLTIERKTSMIEGTGTVYIYCKMRYIGARDGLRIENEQQIFQELEQFFKEFSPIMTKPLELTKDMGIEPTKLDSYFRP